MKNLIEIKEKANAIKGSIFFEIQDNCILNINDRCEGNDINMIDEYGIFELTMTGITERYYNIEEAVQGLIDMSN